MKGKILKSLAFRVAAPVMAIIAIIAIVVYLILIRTISDFSENQIKGYLEETGRDIYYRIFDRSMNELSLKGLFNDDRAIRIEKARVIGEIEDFLRENNLEGSIIEGDRERLNTGLSPELIKKIVEKDIHKQEISKVYDRNVVYYLYHTSFDLWNWHVILLKDASDFSSLLIKVHLLYIVTGFILLLSAFFLMIYLRKTFQEPTRKILNSLKNREAIDYKGINEFETIGSQINSIMEELERETKNLNYLYYIAATKRGEDFFREVVRAINYLFGLNSLIGRIEKASPDAHIIAMYLNGEVKTGFDIPLAGTPCEDVMVKRDLIVVERDLIKHYPKAEVLRQTGADSYIGFAIFNRKGDPIGIINAFGQERVFSESDIKVLQTIGQMVAAEIERLEEEKERELLREHLLQSQKMEAIGTLAGGIAHDFNNMLQGILGYASLLKTRITPADPMYKPVDVIERTAERAAELTRQLLGYARKGKFYVETLNLNDLVGEVMKIIKRTFDRAIEVETKLFEPLWPIEGDKGQLESVILNLCVNARDAMPRGGILTIETYNKELIEGEIPYHWAVPGRYAVIRITDTGTGMDEETKKHIFEPFFTTKEPGKGTGMGLAMVYGVVKNHNGFITVDSEPGKGSTFTIFLPVTKVEDKKEVEEELYPVTGTGTIMVVDDEEAVRELLKDGLSGLGYNIIEASNGREAIDIYTKNKDRIGLVILDLIMPVMGGEETLLRLQEINPEVKVLISTGFGDDESLQKVSKNIVAKGFIKKPFNISEVSRRIISAMKA